MSDNGRCGEEASAGSHRNYEHHGPDDNTTKQGRRPRSDTAGKNIGTEGSRHHARAKSQMDKDLADATHKLTTREDELRALQSSFNMLEADFQRTAQHLSRVRQERDEIKYESNHVSSRYHFIVDHYLEPYAQHIGTHYDDTDGESMVLVLRPLTSNAFKAESLGGETIHLREQVQSLQKEMLAKVEKVQAVSDRQFEQDFRALASSIKSLSRLTRLTDAVDIVEALGQPRLLQNVLSHHLSGRVRNKCLIEIYLWSTLLDMVFENPFKVFGSYCDAKSEMWTDMFGSDFFSRWPTPTTLSETWRYTVAERVVQMVGGDLVCEGKIKQGNRHERQDIEDSVLEARLHVAKCIETGLAQISSAMDVSLINEIVDKAFALGLQMTLQRPRLQITYPLLGSRFVKEYMKCDSLDDGEELSDGSVALVINPGLTKWGDALGKELEQRYDIVPSLVELEATQGGLSLI
ncbi:hypothetical protein FB567DRAFT_575852 [Paraphoma chrysanthemicola]|uniref:Uncharacterized protein n=1 Tax=Paraphoma chrysanthemicola TaxID=798071 RepID=A0A8K0W2T4_9PLEO|nr:hypothetical protein FB567DRAFT_575852 [Paraphoma chrysanthemicola]